MTGIRRAFLPVLLAAAALTCAFAIHHSLACPIEPPPQPLRTLYKVSERVVVARVGAKAILNAEDGVAFVRVALHVTENVKGTPVQLVHLYHTEFVEDADAEKDVGQITINAISGRTVPRLKRDERYLFFLDPREEGDGYEIDDESYGIKQLSSDDLKVYLERMKELAALMREQPEDKHALVEWLVRCAEEPATRWEGAYELFQSTSAAERGDETEVKEEQEGASEAGQAQAVAETSKASGGGEAQAAPEPQAAADPAPDSAIERQIERQIEKLPGFNELRYAPPDPTLVSLLNAVQKQRLSDALVASSEPSEGESFLMQVVKEFGDPRFPGFVLARLHRFENEAPYETELWLNMLAASLKNRQLIELAASYTQDATYYEWDEEEQTQEEQTEAETPSEAAAASAGTGDEEVSNEEVEEIPIDPEVEAANQAANAAAHKVAAERATLKRSAMLKAILARADLFVFTGQLAEDRP